MSATRHTAVSYSRFSSPTLQSAGDSGSSSGAHEYKAFCERHNLTPGKEVFADRGRSEYSRRTPEERGGSDNSSKPRRMGRFDPVTVIVIEALGPARTVCDLTGKRNWLPNSCELAWSIRYPVRLNDIFTRGRLRKPTSGRRSPSSSNWRFRNRKQKSDRVAAS